MTDNDDRKWLYERMQKAGVNTGSYDDFTASMNNKEDRDWYYQKSIELGLDVGSADDFTGMMADKPSTPAQQPTTLDQQERSSYQMAQGNTPTYNYGGQMPSAPRPSTPRSKGNAQPTQTAEAQPLGPEKFAKQMQFEQRMRQRVPSPEAMMQDFSQRMENIRKGNQPFGSASEQRYNPETGKMETVYFTKSGEEVSTPMEQQRINREVSDPVGSELREAYAERDRLNKEIDRRTREVDKANEPSFAQMLAASEGGGYNPVFAARSEDPELSMLWTAKRKNEARIKTLEREGKNEGFFRTLGKTLFSLDTWDFGLFDLIDAGNTMAYGDKKLKGSLGEAQESMMENTYRANVAQQQYGENDTFWQRAGEITGNAIPFVAEFALTGGYSGLTQAGTKAGSKMAAKYATGKVGQWVIKNTGTLVGDMAAGFAMANTTGGMKTAADIINRHQGQLVKDEDGDYVFDGGKSWGRSIYEGEMANTLEYYTEKLGVHLDGAGKVVGGWLGKGMERMGAGRVSELFNRITGSEWAKITGQVLRKGGVQDYPSEVVEEEANILLNSLLVGDNKFSDFVDGKTQADIWGGMMLSIGFMQSPGMVGGGYQTAQYYRYKHKTDMSDRVASTRLTPERWEPLRERIDNTTNDDMRDVISDIIGSQELQDEEKKAAINYVGNLMQMRGYNLRTTADAKDKLNGTEAVDEAVDADNESYQNGYEADEQSRRDIAIEYSMNPDDEIRAAAVDGVRQRIEDDADMEAEGWREEGRKMMHSDGSIRPAVLKVKNENGDDTEVYIVEGNVQMMADGTMVDPETSDRSVVIYDPATGERRMIDPTSDMGILSIGEATSAEDFDYEIQRRRDEYVQRMLDEAQGTVRVELGQPLTMPDGREGTVMAISPDGESFTVVANDGSGEVRMERSDLQQVADAAALADYQARHQEEAAEQPTEEATGEQAAVAPGIVEGAPAEFLPDMEITLLDDAGNEQLATVIGRVRYERGKFVPDENGNIVEYEVDGQVKHENTANLADKVVSHVDATLSAQETPAEQPAAVEQPTVETPTAEVETPAAEPVVEATGTVAEQPTVEPMPMREDGEADFLATTPERGHQFIYNEAGLSREEAGQFVKANLETATKALDKAKKEVPKMGTSLVKYKQQQAEHQAKVDAAQQAVDYWQGVKATQSAIVSAEMAEQAERDRIAHEAAVLEEAARQAEELAKREEQAERGANAVHPAIREKWDGAPKVEGAENEIALANGETLKGRYMLVESGAATPSHNATNGFARSEGFPVDENGQTVNDRDYERDQNAQLVTRQMADQYDSRAIQNVPVVSRDGVVLSGNGRTMAGELAAQNGTDGAYIEHLRKYPQQFGFTPEQVEGMQHPRVVFVPNEAMPYTTENFAKFNQQDMKSQSRTEQSVKMGKTVDDSTFGRIIRSINGFDSLADFYNDPVAATNAIGELHSAGAINTMQLAEMMDGEKVSGQGRQMLENMLIGKAFESNPDAIRQLAEFPAMRQSVVSALAEIANNIHLGEDYSLESELAQAINLAYQARKSDGIGAGEKVSGFARQQSMFPFDEGETVADYTNATVLMLADCLNDGRVSQMKKVLAIYNDHAAQSAAGQYDIFSGGVKSKEEIINDVLNILNNGTETEQQTALDGAAERRKEAAGVGQDGVAGNSDAGSGAAGEENTLGETEQEKVASAIKSAEAEVDTNPTEGQKKAGNYKMGHVNVDGYDITIENPKGSVRRGTDPSGKAWEQEMHNTYGYIRGTEGVDGDHIDVFLSDDPTSGDVFVVDQVNADGTFDEHKVMYGFPNIESAKAAYLSNYEEEWQGLGAITPVSKEEFKKWIESSHRKTKPFSEYASVRTLGDVLLGENQAEEYKAPAKEEGEDVIAYAQRVADAHKAYEENQRHRQEIDEATARVADAVASGNQDAIETASAELEKLTQAEDETLHREGEGNQTVEIPYEESLAKSKAAGYTKKQHDAMVARRWKQRIEQSKGYAERLNLGDRVTVVLNADELEAQGMTLSEEQKKDKGWYNKRTGQIFVILENNTSMDDVLKTILHEGVGHHGLRELFGKHFSQFLWNVYENADESIRGEIVELSKAHGWNTETAIEEYLARLAESENFERPELQSWWQKVKHWFLEMLHKIGFEDFNPERVITDNELRYILWRSYENLVEPDRYRSIVEEAKDIAKQWNLGVGRYEEGAATEGNRWDGEELKAAEPTAAESAGEGMEEVNARFNKELERYWQGSMSSNEHLTIGEPMGKLADYMPNRTIILRQKVLTKALKKHGLDVASIMDLPEALANPIFVFQSTPNTISVLTELHDNNGKNVFVAIELDTAKQLGHEFLEVNDVLTIHGREEENIIKPIIENNSLLWADKEKGHRWLSSVKSNSQAITNDDLLSAAKVIKDFDTAKNNSQDADILHRNGEENVAYMEKATELLLKLASGNEASAAQKMSAYRAIGGNLASLRKAMSLQKEFDKGTVQRVTDLATSLISHGMLDNMKASEVSRLLSAVKNSTGKENIKGGLNTVMDILIDSQLRRAEEMLHKLESVRGSKVDAKGVQVQGQLDIAGQRMVDTFKKARGWQKEAVEEKMAVAEERMGSEDTVEAEEAALEFAGLQMAHDYIEKIQASEMAEEDLYKAIRDEEKKVYTYAEEPVMDADGKPMLKKDGEPMKRTVRHTKPEFKAPMSEENKRIKQQVKEFVAATEESIRHGKTERLQDYMELIGRLSGSMRESMANAKAWKEEQKERVREIQHNANSDMEGTPSNAHYEAKWKDKLANNSFVQFLLSPLGTFDQMLRLFGSKSANGEGYLWNRFMRGWVDARQQEIRGVRSKFAVLDSKAKEVFGDGVKSWGDLIRRVGKLPKMAVGFWDGGEMRDHELTQGNLMYIYMVDKMSDGRMKLRHMGVTEEAVEAITKILDPRLKRLADWMQGEFLADTRKEYNETHKRMFGASMAEIEDYFPLKILANARNDNPETLDNPDMNEGISTKTGSIIKRTANTLDLDLLNADALNVILDHVAQMEHWNAYAEFNRDLNTLRTYKHFRNQVQNMTTVYGSGKELWKRFNDVCQMAAGTYRPPRAKLDTVATNMAKGVTAAKVSLRIYTALKQFLSMPAYIPDARPDLWVKNLATPWKSWSWAMEKLPIFEERWKSRMAGDPRLLKTEMDWKAWRNNVVQMASKIGMSPNAFVDALTVSIGAKTIYETRKARYIKEGYGEEKAEKRAMQDAEVLYNETQQSSEGAFLSTMQVDRSWLSVMFTVFRNSSMAYQRQLHDALRNLKRDLFKKGNREKSIEFMAKQMVREGIGEEQAMINARERYNRQMGKDALRVATFGFIVELAWNLGGMLPYLLFGDDDDKKKKMMDNVWARSMFGWGEGLTGGDVFSQAGQMLVQGEGNPEYLKKEMPITSDAYNILSKVKGGKWGEVVNDMVNLAVQVGIGVNPQSITDDVLAIMDACGDDPALAHETLIAVMRILQVPQSQLKELYFDEVGLSGDEVSQYTPQQLAERYARYQVKRGRMIEPWAWDDEEAIGKEKKKADKTIKERLEKQGGGGADEAYQGYAERHKEYGERLKKIRSTSDYKDATPMEKADMLKEFNEGDPEAYAVYTLFDSMDKVLEKMSGYYLGAKTTKEAQVCRQYMEDYKRQMMAVLGAEGNEARWEERKKLADIITSFYKEYGNLMSTRKKEERLEKEMWKQQDKIDKALWDVEDAEKGNEER